MINLLVTGALGHIGSKFIREIPPDLVKRVNLLDNLATQRYPSLFDLPKEISFRFFEEDVRTADLDNYFRGIDAVVHLAAITDAEGSFSARDHVEGTNVEGTRRVAQTCVRYGCRMIFLSTTSVYGPQRGVVDEECSTEDLNPQSPYAESKLRAERMLQEMGLRDGLEFTICRFGTIYGISRGMRFHTAINKFIWQACVGQPLTVWRTAQEQMRPYLYLGDAVRALLFILQKNLFDNRVYNVLTSNTTVMEIVSILRRHVSDVSVDLVDSPIMNQLSYTVSSDRFCRLGFDFHGTLEQGIQETVEMLRNVRS